MKSAKISFHCILKNSSTKRSISLTTFLVFLNLSAILEQYFCFDISIRFLKQSWNKFHLFRKQRLVLSIRCNYQVHCFYFYDRFHVTVEPWWITVIPYYRFIKNKIKNYIKIVWLKIHFFSFTLLFEKTFQLNLEMAFLMRSIFASW